MAENLVLSLTHVGTALLLIILGYLIRVRRWSWLIAGYNTSSARQRSEYDTVALCNGVGGLMFLLGGTIIIASLGLFLGAIWLTILGWAAFVVAIAVFLVYANTRRRYRK